MSESNQAAVSFPFFGIMFLIFMTLKLCGVIAWSWWWVTAPLWGPLAIVLLIFGVPMIILCAAYPFAHLYDRWKGRKSIVDKIYNK